MRRESFFFRDKWKIGINVQNFQIGFDFQPTVKFTQLLLNSGKALKSVAMMTVLLLAPRIVAAEKPLDVFEPTPALMPANQDCFKLNISLPLTAQMLVTGVFPIVMDMLEKVAVKGSCDPTISSVIKRCIEWPKIWGSHSSNITMLAWPGVNKKSEIYQQTLKLTNEMCAAESGIVENQLVHLMIASAEMALAWIVAIVSATKLSQISAMEARQSATRNSKIRAIYAMSQIAQLTLTSVVSVRKMGDLDSMTENSQMRQVIWSVAKYAVGSILTTMTVQNVAKYELEHGVDEDAEAAELDQLVPQV